MSILGLFDIGKSALFASQAALSVTSNNIANVNTPGYSRQDIVLDIANPVTTSAGSVGRGVTTDGIVRSYDRFLEAQLLGSQQDQGRSAAMDQAWGQIEPVLNEQQGLGLAQPLADFFNAWNDVATSPDSQVPRTVLLQKAASLTSSAKTIENAITSTLKSTNDGMAVASGQINQIASDIASLNDRITQVEAGTGGMTANDLRDQRDAKLTDLAKLVDFTSYEDKSGSLTVVVGMRNLVAGTRTNTMTASMDSSGDRSITLDGMNITSTVRGGQLGGMIASRNDIENNALTPLRKLVASVTQQVNTLHQQGFGLDGSTGNDFFNPLQLTTVNHSAAASITAVITNQSALTLDEYAVSFGGGNYTVTDKQTGTAVASGAYNPAGTAIALSGMNLTISGAVTNADSIFVSPLTTAVSGFQSALTDPSQVAASSTAAGVPGDNTNAMAIAQLTSASVAGLGNTTFSGFYGGLVSTVGAMKSSTADALTFNNNLMTDIQNRRDSVSGVSLDEEAANLLKYQRSYEAGARVISVADQLLQTLLNI